MSVDLGPHLLGRRPNPEDRRDFRLEDYLGSRRRVVELAGAEGSAFTPAMTLEQLSASGLLVKWHDVYAFWHWFDETFLHVKPVPAPVPGPVTPSPVPVPAARAVLWAVGLVSDQANTGHCVGFTGLDFGNTLPFNDRWPNEYGHDLYYLCEPQDRDKPLDQQEGSTSRAICKVLQGLGRVGAYAFTQSAETVRDYLLEHGPVGTGVEWDTPMFSTDEAFYIHPDKREYAGGHELLVIGYSEAGYYGVSEPSFALQNHWRTSWADGGVAYITMREYQALLDRDGDAWAALENPLNAAVRRAVGRAV